MAAGGIWAGARRFDSRHLVADLYGFAANGLAQPRRKTSTVEAHRKAGDVSRAKWAWWNDFHVECTGTAVKRSRDMRNNPITWGLGAGLLWLELRRQPASLGLKEKGGLNSSLLSLQLTLGPHSLSVEAEGEGIWGDRAPATEQGSAEKGHPGCFLQHHSNHTLLQNNPGSPTLL